jgi:anti-sigma factor RsiW
MTSPHGNSWTPSPELLAAYADGELDERPYLAHRRQQIEAWLAQHPEAAAALDANAELSRLWSATTPVEPAPATWARVWTRIEQAPKRVKAKHWSARLWLAGIAALGAAAAVLVVLLRDKPGEIVPQGPSLQVQAKAIPKVEGPPDGATGQHPVSVPAPKLNPVEEPEVLQVATSEEVEILRIAGADIDTLVVGRLPVVGPIILLTSQEVEVRPPVNDQARTEVRMAGSSPMVWTPLPNDDDDL